MATSINIRTGEIPKFSKKLFEELTLSLTKKVKTEAETTVRKKIKAVGAIATKQFYRSVTAEVRKSTSNTFLARVGSDDRAATSLEEGLDPVFVPITKIYEWMRAKGIGNDPAFANYVREKLATEGYEARHIFQYSEEKLLERLDGIVEDILNQEEFFE